MSRGAVVAQFRGNIVGTAWRHACRRTTAISLSLARTPTPSRS